MDSLSCPEKVESWQRVIAEQEQLRENNRKLMQDLQEINSTESIDPKTNE